MKSKAVVGVILALCIILTACSSSFSIVGMWKDADGTIRTFNSDGSCQNVAKIDIGGASPTYTLAAKPDTNGYYLLSVQQEGYNQTTFYVKLNGNDNIAIYGSESTSSPLYNLTRQ